MWVYDCRQGGGCVHQVFAVRHVREKYLANGENCILRVNDLEMVYNTIDRHNTWQTLRVYAVRNFYLDSMACGHVEERMDDYRMARRVLMAEVSGGRVRGRPRLGWMDGVKVALGNRGMTVEAARQ